MTLGERIEEFMDICPGLGWTEAIRLIYEDEEIKEMEKCSSEQQKN